MDDNQSYVRVHKTAIKIIGALLFLVGAVFAGWALGRPDGATNTTSSPPTTSSETRETPPSRKGNASELVNYTLPDGWETHTCEGSQATFVIPNGSTASCGSNPIAPVKISVDTGNRTDCNQLQNQREVKKHTCISLFIDGKKTLKASTEYLASSSYNKETIVDAYYFDSGSGVVLAEYIHSDDNKYQSSFDQLANSFAAK